MAGHAQPRLPLEPLEELLKAIMDLPPHDPEHCGCSSNYEHRRQRSCTSAASLAREMGIDNSQLYRWRREGGITQMGADKVTVHLGLHPLLVWPEWGSEDAA